MCGIIACAGVKCAAEILYNGLTDLEYRGYDSAGISVIDGGKIRTVKRKGRVSGLKPFLSAMDGTAGIGHTRWATHGKPCDKNAHPHVSGKFSVVHNGIIENYAELRAELIAEGYAFSSETDSEVIVHLLNKYFDGNLKDALLCTVKRLKGAFALCVLCDGLEGFAAAKYRNPLILGRNSDSFFAASDMPALAELADSCAVLEDGQAVVVSCGEAKFFDFSGKSINLDFSPVPASARNAKLNGYPHYMLKEINEIPQAVQNTLSSFKSSGCARKLSAAAEKYRFKDIMLCGCGTAYHSALSAQYFTEELLSIPVRAETAGEFRYRKTAVGRGTLFIAVSQSGETADTVEAARAARESGAFVVAVTNVLYSAITGIADITVPVCAGTEVCVAATKSYCGQIVSLLLIAQALAGEEALAQTEAELEDMAAKCAKTIEDCNMSGAARACASSAGVYFIGRGADYPVALEGSLKLKEVSYVPGEGYPAGELKHGTIALVDSGVLAVVVITDKNLAAKTASAVEQIYSRGGRVALVCAEDCVPENLKERAEFLTVVPVCGRFCAPLLSVIPLQLLAYETAVTLGRDPDKPRNLAKSVTVE